MKTEYKKKNKIRYEETYNIKYKNLEKSKYRKNKTKIDNVLKSAMC